MGRFKKIMVGLSLCLGCVYCASYLMFRHNHQIVHRVMKSGDKYTFHAVEGGDAALLGAAMNAQIEIFYLPLCYIERGLWYLCGSPRFLDR